MRTEKAYTSPQSQVPSSRSSSLRKGLFSCWPPPSPMGGEDFCTGALCLLSPRCSPSSPPIFPPVRETQRARAHHLLQTLHLLCWRSLTPLPETPARAPRQGTTISSLSCHTQLWATAYKLTQQEGKSPLQVQSALHGYWWHHFHSECPTSQVWQV